MKRGDPVALVRSVCLGLPEAYEEETWGEATFRVRKKIFCMAGGHDPSSPSVCMKSTRQEQEALLAHGTPFFYPRYVGPKGWIGVELSGPVDWEEVRELVVESYRLVAPKRLVAQL